MSALVMHERMMEYFLFKLCRFIFTLEWFWTLSFNKTEPNTFWLWTKNYFSYPSPPSSARHGLPDPASAASWSQVKPWPIRDEYYYVSTNQRLVLICVNKSEISFDLCQPIKSECYLGTEHGVSIVEEHHGVTGALDGRHLGCLGTLAWSTVWQPT